MKVWIVMLLGENGKWLIRVYSKKDEAVAEMKWLYDQHVTDSPNAVIDLKESDDIMVITLCDEDYIINDRAVMMEFEIDGFKKFENDMNRPRIPFKHDHQEQGNEDML